LKIEKQPVENHEVKVDVALSSEEFEPIKRQAARKIASQVKIPGFRPGKAPFEIIRRNYGDAAIAQEALDIFLEKQYEQILTEGEITPGGMGRLDKIDEVDPPKMTLIIPLAATVELQDYREIREDFEEQTVSDEEIQETLTELKSSFATAEPAEGPAKEGQTVYTMIKADLAEADPETGNTELIAERPYEFIIGKDTDEKSAWPFVGFSQNLIGAEPNQVITTEYTYDENAPVGSLKGKKVVFSTTVQSIKDLVMPAEDVELAKKFGDFETFEAFVEDIKDRLLKQKKQVYENQYIEKAVEKLVDKAEISYAPNALEEEAQQMFEDFKHRISHQGLDFETYLKIQQTDVEKFLNEEIRPNAEAQLKKRLVIQEFAAKEKIKMNFDRFKEIFDQLQSSAAREMEGAKTKKEKQAIANYITNTAMNQSYTDSLFDRLVAIAKGENPEIESDEKPVEGEPEAAIEAEVKSDEVIELPDSESQADQ
jgi:trigger factor